MKKSLVFLLLFSMLASTACGGGSNDGAQTTTAGEPSETTAVDNTHDSAGFLLDSLDPNLDYGGESVKLLIREKLANTEYFVEEQTGEIVDDALFKRNATIQDRLNVKLEYIPLPGEWSDRNSFNGAITQSVLAGDYAYDICAVLSNQLATLTIAGALTDLSSLKHLSFDSPWWNSSLLEELSVDNRLYFASGDASLGLIKSMICIYFNKQLCEDFKTGDIYDIVNRGEWTLDKLVSLTKDVYADLDGDSTVNINDRFGFGFGSVVQMYGFIDAFKMDIIERDGSGVPNKIVFDNERNTEIVQKLFPIFGNSEDFCKTFVEDDQVTGAFSGGRIMFCSGEFGDTSIYREISNFDYGVIPYPKWDENQDGYGTTARATYSSFCIPLTAKDPDMSAAVLECFASESYRTVTPAYFETALKVKYSRDDETAQMFDLIKNSVRFSFATSYTMELNDPQNKFRNRFAMFDSDWASFMATWAPVAQEKLENVMTKLSELE